MRCFTLTLLALVASCGCTEIDTRGRAAPAGAIADETVEAITKATPQTPPSKKYGPFSIEEAYRIQNFYAERLGRRLGRITGYKVAFASEAARQAWGVSEPVTAPLFEGQKVEDGGTARQDYFVNFSIEAELAFMIGKAIDGPLDDVAELKKHVRSVHLAFDMADNRFNAKPTAADVIATGAGAHRYVIGPAHDPAKLDPDALTISILKDGKAVYRGPANAVMDGQWQCLLWQVNHLIGRGRKLEAGQVLLTGAVDKPYAAKHRRAAGGYVADAGPLGRITCVVR